MGPGKFPHDSRAGREQKVWEEIKRKMESKPLTLSDIQFGMFAQFSPFLCCRRRADQRQISRLQKFGEILSEQQLSPWRKLELKVFSINGKGNCNSKNTVRDFIHFSSDNRCTLVISYIKIQFPLLNPTLPLFLEAKMSRKCWNNLGRKCGLPT